MSDPKDTIHQARAEESRARRLLKVIDVCQRLSVSRQTVRKWVRAGKLQAVRLPSKHWRITEASVDSLLTELLPE